MNHFLQFLIGHLVSVALFVVIADRVLERIIYKLLRVGVACQPCEDKRGIRIRCKPVPHTECRVIDASVFHSLDRREIHTFDLIFKNIRLCDLEESRSVHEHDFRIPVIDLLKAYLRESLRLFCHVFDAEMLEPVITENSFSGYLRNAVVDFI